ncbi:hypothetical protein Pint_17977 [Pistacia integerrima]|uniref:Uncharacterized protein n=1 Tax=Pistacia integerrima TaxID=434235 RepID=A0ACC0YTL0_9ROSI|nr:hypothetical protein Pint_17977 [Pistacia integerrima]
MFVFGNSLYDPGNNNFLHINIKYKANYPTGRCSDGLLISDFIALHVNLSSWKPSLEPGLKTSFHLWSQLPSASVACLNIERQLSFIKNVVNTLRQQLGNAEAKKLLTNATCIAGIGGVDYEHFEPDYPNGTESTKLEYVNWVIGNITNVC